MNQTSTASHAPSVNLFGRVRNLAGKLLVPVLVVLAGGGFWIFAHGGWAEDHREALPPEPASAKADQTAVSVTVEPVTPRSVQRVVEAVGTLYGFEEIVISSKVEGRVQRVLHETADRVKPNELLVEIDPTDYHLAVEQAESALQVELAKFGLTELPQPGFALDKIPSVMLANAKLENAQRRMDRTKALAVKNATSAEETETTISEFRMMQAEYANQLLLAKSGLATIRWRQSALASARQQLKDTLLRAPTPSRSPEGGEPTYVMTKRSVAEGTFVRVGGEIGRLAIDGTLKLRVPVPERHSAQVKLDQQAAVYTAAFDEPFVGTVTLINPSVDVSTRTFEVEIQVANPKGELKPGSFAKAIIETHRQDDTPTVPLSALVTFAGVTKIFLEENGKAKEVLVTPGVQTREWVEIAKPPLPRNARVITTGQSGLAAETQVAVRAGKRPGAADALIISTRPGEENAPAEPSEKEHSR